MWHIAIAKGIALLLFSNATCALSLQTFLQRVQNYLQLILLRLLVVPSLMAPINNFVKEEGLDYPPYQSGWHHSLASIAVGDWALEFPYPFPPNVHVGTLLCLAAVTLHCMQCRILCCVQCSSEYNLLAVKMAFCLRHVLGSSAGPFHLCSAPFQMQCILKMHRMQRHECMRYSFSSQGGLCGVV